MKKFEVYFKVNGRGQFHFALLDSMIIEAEDCVQARRKALAQLGENYNIVRVVKL